MPKGCQEPLPCSCCPRHDTSDNLIWRKDAKRYVCVCVTYHRGRSRARHRCPGGTEPTGPPSWSAGQLRVFGLAPPRAPAAASAASAAARCARPGSPAASVVRVRGLSKAHAVTSATVISELLKSGLGLHCDALSPIDDGHQCAKPQKRQCTKLHNAEQKLPRRPLRRRRHRSQDPPFRG